MHLLENPNTCHIRPRIKSIERHPRGHDSTEIMQGKVASPSCHVPQLFAIGDVNDSEKHVGMRPGNSVFGRRDVPRYLRPGENKAWDLVEML